MNDSVHYDRLARAAYDDESKMEEFLNIISEDPGPFFASSLERIYATCDHLDDATMIPGGISVRLDNSLEFDAFADVRGRSVTLRRGVFSLVRDLAELHCSYEAIYSFDGSIIKEPELTHSQIVDVVNESVRQFVTNRDGRWAESNVLRECFYRRMEWDRAETDTRRTSAMFFVRLIAMTCFILAHEIGHISLSPRRWNPFKRRIKAELEELAADRVAAKVLLDYLSIPPTIFSQSPPEPFDDQFSNWLWAGQWYKEQYRHWREGRPEDLQMAIERSGDSPIVVFASEHAAARSVSIAMISLFFNVFSLIERAAAEHGVELTEDYPATSERYWNFRQACLAHPLSPLDLFDMPQGRRGALDDEYRFFAKLFSPC